MTDKDYNVYNTFDVHYVNYGELYKNPRDMNMNSKELIGDYADALMKGPSDAYINSPELLGNRYFLDTNTHCLDKNDNEKVQNRSVLVDNINASALAKSKYGNKGLIYSLLASMKSINSDKMFNMEDGEPISYAKRSPTGYLEHIDKKDMPQCTSVTVYTDDKKERDITGWVTEDDRDDIDPLAIKEGMSAKAPPMAISGSQTGEDFMSASVKQQAVLDQNVSSTQETATKEAETANQNAQAAIKKSQQQAKDHGQNASQQTTSFTQSNMAEQKKRSQAAKQAGAEVQLKRATKEYLSNDPPNGANGVDNYGLIIKLINTTYSCGENNSNYRRIPYTCVQEIWNKIQVPDQDSSDARRNDLCSGEYQKLNKPISPKNMFDSLIKLMKDNQNNTNPINSVSGFPPKEICIMAFPKSSGDIFTSLFTRPSKVRTMVDGSDYTTMNNLLNTYRFDIAKLIVRYESLNAYGHCKAAQDEIGGNQGDSSQDCCSCEGFTDTYLQCPKQHPEFQWMDICAWIYMLVLFLVLFYIFYRIVIKSFSLDKVIKLKLK